MVLFATCVYRAVVCRLLWPSNAWMIRMSVSFSSRWVAKLWRSVCTVTRLLSPEAAQTERHAACSTQHSGANWVIAIAARKQPMRWLRQAPVGAQNAQQLWREHDISVAAAFAMLDADDHAAAVDVGNFEACRFGCTQSSRIGRGQCRTGFKARHGTPSRKRTTSSAPSTTGSLRGSRACGIRSGRSC